VYRNAVLIKQPECINNFNFLGY